ncbi:hypothetical protein P167DRAFT_481825 [Morchella conica CCBAS932]|uniref:Rap-GAP domain-containing protein n=1 Tax=Morchella conica CCBAS932 TaxID=1392247 RepID=A0A3N4LDT3_9PEZI|nr:hypothetical protein P167DRAFT_481825 [Morchella conica CCBAS932]
MPSSSQSNVDPPQLHDSNKPSSSIANVFRSFGGRLNRTGFSIPPSPAAPITSNGHRSSLYGEYFGEDAVTSGQVLVDRLKASNPLSDRVAAAEALRTIIADYPVSTVTEIWANAQDLLDADNPPEVRQAAFKLLSACIQQHEPSPLDRLKIYRTIALHVCMDDFYHQLQALTALTNGGRDVSTFHKDLVSLLSKWLKNWFKEATLERSIRKRDGGNPENMSGAEFNLRELFQFTTQVIKFNFKSFEEREINQLLLDVLQICKKTTHKKDIECSIGVIEALITYGYVPRAALKSCIEVLCGAYATLRDLADATWNAVSNLCKSYMAHNSVLVLLEILETPAKNLVTSSANANTNTLKGAVWFLEKLLIADEQDGLPPVQFPIVMSAFRSALAADSARLELEICRAISAILASKDVVSQISFDEWAVPLDILVACSSRTTERADGTVIETRAGADETSSRPQKTEHGGLNAAIAHAILQVITQLEIACRNPEFEQTDEVVDFFVRVHEHLPNSAAEYVINHYATEHLCYPSCGEWIENCRKLLDIFFKARSRPTAMRISVLSLIKDVYETTRELCEEDILRSLVLSIFEDFRNEGDLKVLEALVMLAVDVAGDSNIDLFNVCLDILVDYIGPEEPVNDQSIPEEDEENENQTAPKNSSDRPKPAVIPHSQQHDHHHHHLTSPVNIVTRGLVRIFMRSMNVDALKTARTYEEIIKIVGSKTIAADARLTAMKLLFRIRSDSENAIFLVESTESENLAAVFHRITKIPDETPAPSKPEEDSSSTSRSNRSNSISQTSQQTFLFRSPSRPVVEKYDRAKRKSPIWAYPETKALPEKPSYEASPILCTFYDPPKDYPVQEGPSLDPKTCIRMSLWMEQVIPIMQQGCDWEIYSYVLVHLSSQLANKTAFRNCKAHINMLRSYICHQLHTDKIPNTDLPEEVKKADIAIALINILTTLISYKQHFAKNETEGIVKAFQLGLYKWQRTAKPCIHALSICCYELPGSTSKFLPGILTKLSQIITSSAVSVHILEFLLALAKLPTLYSNFTEPDFRNIFGIAFRYIQHTKESTASGPTRAMQSQPETEPSLPQYVLTLAYNVLTTWFLSLRLSERPKYVSWITRGLVLHAESNTVDEQSQACMDMLQRFTFSDFDLKPPAKIGKDAAIVTKNWLVGGSIITVHMTTETGVARLVVRRPSGTSYYSMKPESRDLHSTLQSKWVNILDTKSSSLSENNPLETNTQPDKILPSHVLLQLAGGIGTTEMTRPVLLPDDDKTTRALDVFDRIPVVDFHKIGVVYAGPGQSTELDILTNQMGSPDYTDFVDGLGELITLKGTDRNTGGLDRENDLDGQFAYFWSDRITEIVFHVTTMMPTLAEDPQCTMKKRHIGNDFVNIVFNNSGLPWRFGTIPSQFNFVSIVITPEARTGFISSRLTKKGLQDKKYYRVQVCRKEGFSDISPAQETKIVSDASLPAFVRNLALSASVYSHVYNEGGGEHISNWRHRLRNISRLRERTATGGLSNGGSVGGGGAGGSGGNGAIGGAASPSTMPNSRRVSTMSGQTSLADHGYSRNSVQLNGADLEKDLETEDLLMSLDFSRFT